MSGMYTQPSVILQRGPEVSRDAYNAPVYGPDVRVEAPCWYVHMSSQEESQGQGAQMITGYKVQWPARYYEQVRACDAVELPIGRYEVEGRPAFQADGLAIKGYVQAVLQEVLG